MKTRLQRITRGRRGFALIAALVALVIIALLITGAFFAGGQDMAVSRAELRDRRVFAYAEYAAAHAIDSWNAADRGRMSSGETWSLEFAGDLPLESTVFVTRLDSALYAVVAEARLSTAEGNGLSRRVGILVTSVRDGVGIDPPTRVAEHAWTELY